MKTVIIPKYGQGGELNFHGSELEKRGTVQKMQEDWDM